MMVRRLLLTFLIALSGVAAAQTAKSPPLWCMVGGQAVVTQGLASTNPVQISLPLCTVTVNVHGSGLATIYSDANNTPLANPFTSNSDATYAFYASVASHYDIITQATITCVPFLNGCSAGGTLAVTTTLSDVLVGAIATSGGTITGVSGTASQGLVGGGTSGAVTLGVQPCAANQIIQSTGAGWQCASLGVGTITSVTATTGLTGGGSSGAVTLGITVCPNGQTLISNGTTNACGALGVGTLTGVATSPTSGLAGGGTSGTLNLTLGPCPSTQVWQSSGAGAWACGPNGTGTVTSVGATTNGGLVAAGSGTAPTLGLITTCANGQILVWNSGTSTWACGTVTGIGAIVAAPAAAQTIVQPEVAGVASTLSVNSFNNLRIVTASWNWAYTDTSGSIGNLTSAGASKTLTLPCSVSVPCPAGLDTASISTNHYVYAIYVSGTGTPEAAPVTGGTCVPAATAPCTLVVTTVNAHPNGYVIGSASTGIQEAWNDAWTSDSGNPTLTPNVRLASNLNYDVYASVYLRGRAGVFDGRGSLLVCHTRDRCIYIGTNQATPFVNHHKLYNLSMTTPILVNGANISSVSATGGVYSLTTAAAHPFVAGDTVDCEYHSQNAEQHWVAVVLSSGLAASTFQVQFGATTFSVSTTTFGWCNILNAAIENNSDHVALEDLNLYQVASIGTGAFNYGVVNDNDQQFIIERAANRSSSSINPSPGLSTSTWPIGAFFYQRTDQGNAGIMYVHNTELTNVNCATSGGNGFVVSDTVCQGFLVYGIRYFGSLQPATFTNVYQESTGGTVNPLYANSLAAQLGYIFQGGGLRGNTILGTFPLSGLSPTFANSGAGAACTVRNYFVIPQSSLLGRGPLMYIGKSNTSCTGVNVLVQWPSIELQDATSASIGTLTWDILVTIGAGTTPPLGTGSFSIATANSGTCSNGMCSFTDTQAASSSYTVNTQQFTPAMWFWPTTLAINTAPVYLDSVGTTPSAVAAIGQLGVSIIARRCQSLGALEQRSPILVTCLASDGAGGSGTIATYLQQQDTSGGGPVANSKGRINLGKQITAPNDLVTLQDANFSKTATTGGQRPLSDATDMAIGTDVANGLNLRAGSFVSFNLNSIPTGSNWLWQLSTTQETAKVPFRACRVNGAWDAALCGTGSDGAAKIASIIADATKCPNVSPDIGCIISAIDMTGTDLIWKSNPFHGNNRTVTLLLGDHIYVACVPIVSGQTGYTVYGYDASASVLGATVIQAGTSGQCGGTAFPGGASPITFPWQHGPFLPTNPDGGASYSALYSDCGQTSTDSPASTTDCFGSGLYHVKLDGQDLANFGYYTCCAEERSGLRDVSIQRVRDACGFWDRGFQTGPQNGGGSGPTHFGAWDTVCTVTSTLTNRSYGFVAEGNTTLLTFAGGGSGAQGYVLISGGNPAAAGVVTKAGTGYPNGANAVPCTLNSPGGTGSTCTGTTDGAGHLASIAFDNTGSDGLYPTAQVPGGGPIFIRSTIAGASSSNCLAAAGWFEGYYNLLVDHWHIERMNSYGVLMGGGNAPYTGGQIRDLDVTVNGCASSGDLLHWGVGATTGSSAGVLDTNYSATNIIRLVSSGNVIVDDNTGCTLATTDTPKHAVVAYYTGNINMVTAAQCNPTISGFGGTGAALTAGNGPYSFRINVGTVAPGNGGTIAMGLTAVTGWNCQVNNLTAKASNRADNTVQVSSTTTTAVIQNQTTSTGAAINWTASDILTLRCSPN